MIGRTPEDAAARRRDEVWNALDHGDLETAHRLAEKLSPADDDHEGRLVVAIVQQETGRAYEAYTTLRALADVSLDGDLEFTRRAHHAECAYALGEPEEALDIFFTLEPDEKEEQAQLLWARGLCYDHLGRRDRADKCFREASELVPEFFQEPIGITPDEMEAFVAETAEAMPPQLAKTFEEVPVVIQDLPTLELIRGSRGEVHPDTLGLYVGAHLLEQSHLDAGGIGNTIYLFRRNLERIAEDRPSLEEQIRITLLHELGHHLGFEEDGLDQMGLA